MTSGEQEATLTFQERGIILIMGHLNSRVGTQVDDIDEDDEAHLELPDYNYLDGSINDIVEQNTNVIKDIISDDVIINENGKELLQLCRSTNLYILNGRIGPMPEGRCTCQTARGQSVVDYIIASADLLLLTKSFQIGETSPLSDHRCVTATLQCKDNSSSNMHTSKSKSTDRQIVLYKWKDEHKEQYVKNLNTLTDSVK